MKPYLKRHSIAALAMVLCCAAAQGQTFPNKPIHIVVPFAPGGGTDVLTRIVAQQMSEEMKVPVVIDNKPGAGGALAAAIVVKAPACSMAWLRCCATWAPTT